MKIQSLRVLRGPNVWCDFKAIEARVSAEAGLAALETAFERIPEPLAERLRRAPCEATTVATALAVLARGLQEEIGVAGLDRARALPGPTLGESLLIVPYREESVGRRAVELAVELLDDAVRAADVDFPRAVSILKQLDEEARLGPSTASLARAAEDRGVPVTRVTDGSLLQLGYGARQRRVWAAETDETSAIAEAIAQDKNLTKELLGAIGIPVPEGHPAASADEAWRIAEGIGLPVVVKPQKGNQGKGVSVRLSTEDAVRVAFDVAATRDGLVLVERYVAGLDFRLLVVGDRLVAAARREAPAVVGDGVRTVEELVELENQNPRRGDDHATSLSKRNGRRCRSHMGRKVDEGFVR